MRTDFQGLSPAEEVIAEVSTHVLCKRLHYVLSVNQIHTRVFLSVNRIQTSIYDYFYDSHSSDANGQMTYYDWRYILSIPSTSMKSHLEAITDILSLLSARDKKLLKQVDTSNPTYLFQSYLNRSKNLPQKSKKLPPFFCRIVEGRIECRIQPCQEKKEMNTLPCAAPPVFYLRSNLHGAVSPPPPYNSRSSASTTAPRLSPAVVVLRLCRRSFVDCCFFVIIRRISSAAVFLQTAAPPTQPPRPSSRQPSLLSAFAAAHLLIVVFCHCCQRHCSPSTTNPPPRLFSRRRPPPHPPSSSTSSYLRP